jgi:4-carboxymuconolactone decarboxylase
MPRLPDLDPATLDENQKRVYDAIVSGPRGKVEGPLRVWLTSPDFAERAEALGAYCRFGSALPPRLSELAILVVGADWRAGFEFFAHAPIAIAAGLDPAAVEAIRKGDEPALTEVDEIAVYDFAHELVTMRRVSHATYDSAERALGRRGVVDLVGILGYYTLISMTINAFEVPIPAPGADPFKDSRSSEE